MRYALVFTVLGLAVCAAAACNRGWAWLALWPGIALLIVGLAYGFQWHGLWDKSQTGAVSSLRTAFLAPYNGLTWLIWHFHRIRSSEAPSDLVIPASGAVGPVWLGRWPFAEDLPGDASLVVDLLAEWPVRRGVRDGRSYRCYPLLDGCAPAERRQFLRLVEEVAMHSGTAYVHCALGHGRSGLFVAAVLLKRKLAADPEVAILRLKAVRPGVGLNRIQMAYLQSIVPELTGE